ncbi:1-aminocyclopropane-1-carboxylate deaminase/D-cysteine desulfhydrase [Aliikangiella sp. G2MR2-5]|uniref:1-aminocyclopropane-1-carboxylate deaminase/D-cysteine desulfhydrase n=1 Tax=Aliikangiella sp. G2MR2-5 TaxID=2788943 RepID=UPI0018AB814F|nr:pyridoxal-phosphate dependent enzyme [Aliikangiella sp. G2MR2-5]
MKVSLEIKRDDLLHPLISGNKWRKLKHLLLAIEEQGSRSVAVMGGRYSNLLHTVSYIGYLLGWKVKLYVRGYPEQPLTPMLKDALRWGATIHLVDRQAFRELREAPPKLEEESFWIPEGGFDRLAVKGTIESLMEVPKSYDYIVIASATGTSMAGYIQATRYMKLQTKVLGVAVLKNDDEIEQHLNQLLAQEEAGYHLLEKHWQDSHRVIKGYEFGGYAKSTSELDGFIEKFEAQYHIPLERVYSGKSFFATIDLIEGGYFEAGSRILLIHCGGLQGLRQ